MAGTSERRFSGMYNERLGALWLRWRATFSNPFDVAKVVRTFADARLPDAIGDDPSWRFTEIECFGLAELTFQSVKDTPGSDLETVASGVLFVACQKMERGEKLFAIPGIS